MAKITSHTHACTPYRAVIEANAGENGRQCRSQRGWPTNAHCESTGNSSLTWWICSGRSDAITLFIDGKSPPSHNGPCPSAFEESSDAALGKDETRHRKEGCLSILPPYVKWIMRLGRSSKLQSQFARVLLQCLEGKPSSSPKMWAIANSAVATGAGCSQKEPPNFSKPGPWLDAWNTNPKAV